MIIINSQTAELARGWEHIQDFLNTMRTEWLPGFERSYQRRSREYRAAMEKYEGRGLFLRTLLRKPKAPQRMPVRHMADVETMLQDKWRNAIRAVDKSTVSEQLSMWQETLNDDFLALTSLSLDPHGTSLELIIGPHGLLIPQPPGNGRTALLVELLRGNPFAHLPIHNSSPEAWPPDPALENNLDPLSRFKLADILLQRQQDLDAAPTFSALAAAEKLTAQEKDTLLRMAATL